MSVSRPTPHPSPPGPAIDPPKIHLTTQAVEKVREMLEEEDLLEEGGLRISAHSGAGCSAPLQFGLTMDVRPEAGDIVLEGQGIRIFMDPDSAWSLDGLRVDYVDAPHLGEGFAFQHPRGRSGRSC
jgi:iron-sulfur cluster assembly accessory protein